MCIVFGEFNFLQNIVYTMYYVLTEIQGLSNRNTFDLRNRDLVGMATEFIFLYCLFK